MAQPPVPVPQYPDVPRGSGVPAIFRDPQEIVFKIILLQADVATIFRAFIGSQWGVFSQYGAPVAIPDSFISIDYRKEWRVADYPIENGGFQSYDKVVTPFDIRVRMACDGTTTPRSLFLTQVDNMATSMDLFQVLTPDASYKDVNIVHYDFRRERSGGVGIILVDIWLVEIRPAGATQFVNTQSSSGATDVNGGLVQPVQPTPSQAAQVGGGSPNLTSSNIV